MTSQRTFVDVLRDRVADLADETAVTFLSDSAGLRVDRELSYVELDRAARARAVEVGRVAKAGDRVLLLHPWGPEFLTSFLGCLYAGVVPVPGPDVRGRSGHLERLDGIVADATPVLALTDDSNLDRVRGWAARTVAAGLPILNTNVVPPGDPEMWRRVDVDPGTPAFLQYTSGSTAEPRGIMVSHAGLLHNLELIGVRTGMQHRPRYGSWLPFSHDMGLIGMILEPLFQGGSTVLMDPMTFLKRPHRWLEMMSRFGVEASSAPNFAYDLCVRRITDDQLLQLDLSCWRTAGNGSEPISATTVRQFSERFAVAGFRPEALVPCYGLAEATLMVTTCRFDRAAVTRRVDARLLEQGRLSDAADDAPGHTLVSSGTVRDDDVLIVAPDTARPMPNGHVGEIWVRGQSLALGYWGRPEESRHTFQATTAEGVTDFLRTGDLGVVDSGELYVTGRSKDVLIVRGRNIYPHDLEREVAALEGPFRNETSCSFTVTCPESEVVIVQETRQRRAAEPALNSLVALIRATVSRAFDVRVDNVVLVRPGAVARTTSGKVRRATMRERFLAGALSPLYEELTESVRAYREQHRSEPASAAAQTTEERA